MKVLGFMLLTAASALGAVSSNDTVFNNERLGVHAGADAEISNLTLDGELDKTGAGKLTLSGFQSRSGTLRVLQGSVLIPTEAEADTPPRPESLALWLDATRNVVTNEEGAVLKWLDAREQDPDAAQYVYNRAEHAWELYGTGDRFRTPYLRSSAWFDNQWAVDFGKCRNLSDDAAWIPFRQPDGTRAYFTIYAAVYVVAHPKSHGNVLADWDWSTGDYSEDNHTGTIDFLAGLPYAGDINWFAIFDPQFRPAKGDIKINGEHATVISVPSTEAQVVSIRMSDDLPGHASNLSNMRNQGTQGGIVLGEILIYTNRISAAEINAAEGYLARKWRRGGRYGSVEVAQGATLTTAGTTTGDRAMAAVTGSGTWRKSGHDTVTLLRDFAQFRGTIALEGGTISDGGDVRHETRLFNLPATGGSIDAGTNSWTAGAAPAGTFVKSGDGAVAVSGIPETVSKVRVSGGTLSLSAPVRSAIDREEIPVHNGSFEIWSDHDQHGPWGGAAPETWGLIPNGTGWTFTWTNPDVCGEPSGAGICKPASSPWMATPQPAPDGEWAAFFRNEGSLSTTFTAPSAGDYELTFWSASRSGNNWNHHFNIVLDGTVIGDVYTCWSYFIRHTYSLRGLAAGSHTLAFVGIRDDNQQDRTSLIDDVKIFRVGDAPVRATLANGTFEVSDPLTEVVTDNGDYRGLFSFEQTCTGSGWSFCAKNGLDVAGLSYLHGVVTHEAIPEGMRCAYIRNNGWFSTTVTFPTNGTYRVSYLHAARLQYRHILWLAGERYLPNDYCVKLDDQVVSCGGSSASLFAGSGTFTPQAVYLTISDAPATKTLKFEGKAYLCQGGECWAFFDDIRLDLVDDEKNSLEDGGFEVAPGVLGNNDQWDAGATPSAACAWTFTLGQFSPVFRGNSGITRTNAAWPMWNTPEGTCCALLNTQGAMSQTFTVKESGYQMLSFLARGRDNPETRFAPHDFEISYDGVRVGYVKTTDAVWREYSFRLPYALAGETHNLTFTSVDSFLHLYSDHVTFFDTVRVKAVPALSDTPVSVNRNAEIEMAKGTTLVLDAPGTFTVRRLTYAGRAYGGKTLNAATAPFIRGCGELTVSCMPGTLLVVR